MTTEADRARRQLVVFAKFTEQSLGEADLDTLMLTACVRSRMGVGVSHAKLMEYIPSRDRMLLKAGVGWREGLVGNYEIPPSLNTVIGAALVLAEPIAVADYTKQTQYEHPQILLEHGCIASLNVPLRTDSGLFGVLEVDHIEPREFTNDDIAFLTGLGNTVAQAIKLRRALSTAEAAATEKNLLLQEMNHRIKNNLSLVSAILSIQSKRFDEPSVRSEFMAAVNRIRNLALVHERLQVFAGSTNAISAELHFRELCELLRSLLPPGITLDTSCSGTIGGDCVEALTLITNELVTNAAKYAFQGRQRGTVTVGYREEGAGWRLWVSDDGVGFAEHHASTSFGQQMIGIMVSRLNAEISYSSKAGTRVDVVSGTPAAQS